MSKALVPVLLLASVASAQDTIAWSKDLATAFADAKAKNKVIMICVNAKYVDGRKTEERANKGLREVVYKNAKVVAKSREFVCALITPGSGSSEFGELRLLGIEGAIVSPQHIFVRPEGDKIRLREQYWSHGKGDAAVAALLSLMDKALGKPAGDDPKADEPEVKIDPPTADNRAAWIAERIAEVVDGGRTACKRAVDLLIRHDKDGDCVNPLVAVIPEQRKNAERLVVIVRELGRDKFVAAAAPIADLLTHKKLEVRGNAAVSLEYIGSNDKKVIAALKKAAGREKDETIANHMYRALGRCGVEDGGARSFLLKKCGGAKSEFASYGPALGLAYFEGDKKAARGMEKLLKKIGIPGGRRGGGQNTVKRGVFSWTLASIGDEKSADFMREEMLAKLENVQAFWVGGLRSFYRTVARACEGDSEALAGVAQGVRGFVGFAKGANPSRYDVEARSLMDECRKGRESEEFRPKGDYLLGGG
jgi:hypothetical protein